jgi:uncharacterized protein DUF4232
MIATGTLLAGLAAACGNGGQQTASHQSASHQSVAPLNATTTAASSATTQSTTPQSTGQSAARATSPKTPECKAADLRLSLGEGQGGAAGSSYPAIQFTNSGTSNCVIVGFPGVSYVGGDDGHQVGAPASRDGKIGAQMTLAPGQMASAIVREVDPENYPTATCKPVTVRGLRIYPPDDTAAMFLPFKGSAKACSTNIDQLSVQTIQRGSGNE